MTDLCDGVFLARLMHRMCVSLSLVVQWLASVADQVN